jgi:hypothetical protein
MTTIVDTNVFIMQGGIFVFVAKAESVGNCVLFHVFLMVLL